RESRDGGGPRRALLGSRARAPGLSGTVPLRLHLPLHPAELEAAGAAEGDGGGVAAFAFAGPIDLVPSPYPSPTRVGERTRLCGASGRVAERALSRLLTRG